MERLSLAKYLAIVGAYFVLPFLFSASYHLRVLNTLLIFTLFTISLNVIFGHTKQLFLCQGALAAIGAYTSSLMVKGLGMSIVLTLPLGALASAAIGALLSYVAAIRRLTIIFLVILTLSFQLILEEVLVGLRDITGGSEGFTPPEFGLGFFENTFRVGRETAYYYAFYIMLIAALLLYDKLVRSPMGFAFNAIFEGESTARFLGINVTRYRVLAASISSSILGLTGAMYGYYNQYVTPSLFNIASIDVIVLVMLVFGGMGTFFGPLFGAAIFTLINEALRPLGPLTTMVFGILLVILFLLFRQGVIPFIQTHVTTKLLAKAAS